MKFELGTFNSACVTASIFIKDANGLTKTNGWTTLSEFRCPHTCIDGWRIFVVELNVYESNVISFIPIKTVHDKNPNKELNDI
jgi:hypothetical protein